MNALSNDIRQVCQELLPGCKPEGWGNVLNLRGYCIRVAPAGLLMGSWIQVAVTLKGAPSGTSIPFFRELDREGLERNEWGATRLNTLSPTEWLRASIQDALAWVEQHGLPPDPPPGPADFLFQEDEK